MSKELPYQRESLIVGVDQFSDWRPLDDSIMGGKSNSICQVRKEGLFVEGNLVEEGGGFISCRSSVMSHPLDLSSFSAFQLNVDGDGRTLKFAVACKDKILGLVDLMDWGLRWVAEFPTNESGTTQVIIPFTTLKPTVRAKSVTLPIKFDSSVITQFQLLHSKFGQPGELNKGFRPGPIKILLRSIHAI